MAVHEREYRQNNLESKYRLKLKSNIRSSECPRHRSTRLRKDHAYKFIADVRHRRVG